MQVSFRIDAASYAGFRLYSPVFLREGSGTVVVTCDEAEVEFTLSVKQGYQDSWVAQRLGDPIDAQTRRKVWGLLHAPDHDRGPVTVDPL